MTVGATIPFRPTGTASLNAMTSSTSVALEGAGASLVVTNATGALAYVQFGSSPSISASTFDMPVLPNSQVMLCVNDLASHAAGMLSSGSGTIMFTRGYGSFL